MSAAIPAPAPAPKQGGLAGRFATGGDKAGEHKGGGQETVHKNHTTRIVARGKGGLVVVLG